jgi:hypothetical protein
MVFSLNFGIAFIDAKAGAPRPRRCRQRLGRLRGRVTTTALSQTTMKQSAFARNTVLHSITGAVLGKKRKTSRAQSRTTMRRCGSTRAIYWRLKLSKGGVTSRATHVGITMIDFDQHEKREKEATIRSDDLISAFPIFRRRHVCRVCRQIFPDDRSHTVCQIRIHSLFKSIVNKFIDRHIGISNRRRHARLSGYLRESAWSL